MTAPILKLASAVEPKIKCMACGTRKGKIRFALYIVRSGSIPITVIVFCPDCAKARLSDIACMEISRDKAAEIFHLYAGDL